MKLTGGDSWRGEFRVSSIGLHRYTIEAWIDRFKTWRGDLMRRIQAGQDLQIELLIGADAHRGCGPASRRAPDADALRGWARRLRESNAQESGTAIALEEELLPIIERYPDPHFVSRYEKELPLVVDRAKARFSTWYEVFPRSCSPEAGRHGTLKDCEAWLPYIAAMGFDVVYLPPIHPIGEHISQGKKQFARRRSRTMSEAHGRSVRPRAATSPIHPQLGTLEDFRHFLSAAAEHGLEVALDIAFQCSPDHPYVREHPEWFRKRPDGTIQYAENPPKKYQDIYPLNFETPAAPALWEELKSVLQFWIDQGVRIFRVDNPHTKAFPFWQWVIEEIKSPASGRDLPRGGLHQAARDVLAGEARLLSVLHLFCLAQYEAGTDRILHRADANGRSRIFPPQSLARRRRTFSPSSCKWAAGPRS